MSKLYQGGLIITDDPSVDIHTCHDDCRKCVTWRLVASYKQILDLRTLEYVVKPTFITSKVHESEEDE